VTGPPAFQMHPPPMLTSPLTQIIGYIGDTVLGGDIVSPG